VLVESSVVSKGGSSEVSNVIDGSASGLGSQEWKYSISDSRS